MPDPQNLGTPVPTSTMRSPGEGVREGGFSQINANGGDQTYALGVATLVRVDYEKFEATLRIETGETFENVPIPITFPAAGNRHFLGALPMVGDGCVIGWGMQESGRTRQPYILGWLIGGVTAGHDWWPTQPVGPDEFALPPKERTKWEGIADRIRHKLRHMRPGEIVASSGQGADLVLNEGVIIANRRGNEIRLRDQDQALIVRSLQQFHAGAGFRIYGGMIQRDGFFLPTSMVSDGVDWAAPQQLDEDGVPLDQFALDASDIAAGFLSPHKIFLRDANGDPESGIEPDANLDPYVFLQQGLFIDALGRVTGKVTSDAVYGGKSLYRLSTANTNAAIDEQADAFSEFRIEVSHTSDGTLPVTEQTDGFDADRLPDAVPRITSALNTSINAPFIEWVMGTVVGNDPFSLAGKPLYGVPLRPVVFSGEARAPKLTSGLGSPVTEHAAAMFKITPPLDPAATPTWWTATKDGRLQMSVAGSGTSFSAEAAFGFGLRLGAGATQDGESFRLDTDGRIYLHASRGDNATGRGIEMIADQGAVRIFGGASETVGGIAQRVAPSGGGEETLPGVTIESATSMLLRASRGIQLSAPTLDLRDITNLSFSANSGYSVASGDSISTTTKVDQRTSMGKTTETFGGPKDGLPTNGALRETSFVGNPATGFVGGTADKYDLLYGDRTEILKAGNHTTTVVVGNMAYTAAAGTWTATAGTNNLAITPATGITGTVSTGAVVFNATAGSATIMASMGIAVVSTGGGVLVQGKSVVLSATGGKTGGIVSGADIDPVSGSPLALLGMGSFTQLLAGV